MNITYSECVRVALVVRHAKSMLLIYYCFWLHHSFPKTPGIQENIFEPKKNQCLDFPLDLCEIVFVLRRIQRGALKRVLTSSVKVPVHACQVVMKI